MTAVVDTVGAPVGVGGVSWAGFADEDAPLLGVQRVRAGGGGEERRLLLGPDRCARVTHVRDVRDVRDVIVAQTCPGAIRVTDPFHGVKWATEALDEVRREARNDARAMARTEPKRGCGRPRADAPSRPGSERAVAKVPWRSRAGRRALQVPCAAYSSLRGIKEEES